MSHIKVHRKRALSQFWARTKKQHAVPMDCEEIHYSAPGLASWLCNFYLQFFQAGRDIHAGSFQCPFMLAASSLHHPAAVLAVQLFNRIAAFIRTSRYTDATQDSNFLLQDQGSIVSVTVTTSDEVWTQQRPDSSISISSGTAHSRHLPKHSILSTLTERALSAGLFVKRERSRGTTAFTSSSALSIVTSAVRFSRQAAFA
eukprot:740457-Pelagomonas_calceolata.AAC.2